MSALPPPWRGDLRATPRAGSVTPDMVADGFSIGKTKPTLDIGGNDTDTPFAVENGVDRDLRVRLKAGSTATYRAYLDWRSHSDVETWLFGATRDQDVILFDSVTAAHRLQCDQGAVTYLSSAGANPVRVNGHPDDASGTAGLGVWSGGASPIELHRLGAATATQWLTGPAADVLLQLRNNVTVSTAQDARIGARHYDGTDVTMAMLHASAANGTNELSVGGGTASMEAATAVKLYAGATSSSGAGIEVARVTHLGVRIEPAGVGGVAEVSSVLDVRSTTKGVLFPRMTTAQRDAIATPAEGLTIWNTTTKALESYNGTVWG